MIQLILDPNGSSPLENGYEDVSDDITLLKGITGGKSLFVRGERLCKWASHIAEARGYKQIWRKSPSQELAEDCPGLTLSESEELLTRIDQQQILNTRPVSAYSIVKQLWAELSLWNNEPSTQHALDWLTWCSENSFSIPEKALLRVIKEKWSISAEELAFAYNCIEQDDAWRTLQKWLGISDTITNLPPLPTNLPSSIIDKLTTEWRSKIVRTDGNFIYDLLDKSVAHNLITLAARLTFEYFCVNSASLGKHIIHTLQPFLNHSEIDKLYNLLPPEDPGLPPNNFNDVVEWFRDSYIPFRIRTTQQSLSRINEIARHFAQWFLPFYAQARAGGYGSEYLSWCKSSKLESMHDSVTLLTVLDGLGMRDGEYLVKLLRDKSRRVEVDDFELVISPIPTVTCLSKPALLTGFNPSCALEEDLMGTVERRASNVITSVNNANNGDVVIWSILEPDHTYHQSNDPETIRSDVSGWLQSFADRLIDVIHNVSDTKKIKVIITTDHGRLMSSANRLHTIPQNMEAQGRAAWGQVDMQFDDSGYRIVDDIVFLHPERFGTTNVCALLLSNDAFVTADGRGGTEYFPHGGIFPEEVLIPWIQLSRDRASIIVEVSLSGKGVAGSTGTYTLDVLNSSEVRISIIELDLPSIEFKTPIRHDISAMSRKTISIPVAYWPTSNESENLEARLIYALPTGERNVIVIKPSLEIEEMYKQDDILSEL